MQPVHVTLPEFYLLAVDPEGLDILSALIETGLEKYFDEENPDAEEYSRIARETFAVLEDAVYAANRALSEAIDAAEDERIEGALECLQLPSGEFLTEDDLLPIIDPGELVYFYSPTPEGGVVSRPALVVSAVAAEVEGEFNVFANLHVFTDRGSFIEHSVPYGEGTPECFGLELWDVEVCEGCCGLGIDLVSDPDGC